MSFFSEENLRHFHNTSDLNSPVRRRGKSIPGTSPSSGPVLTNSSTRKRVTRVEDIELTDSRERRRGSFSGASYKSYQKFDFKKHLRRTPWYLFTFFFLRLFFMDRGVIEYFDSKDKLALMEFQLKQGKEEITLIKEELELIKTSRSYQKKLARDHLGVIGPDEYLVLFAQENKAPSI